MILNIYDLNYIPDTDAKACLKINNLLVSTLNHKPCTHILLHILNNKAVF